MPAMQLRVLLGEYNALSTCGRRRAGRNGGLTEAEKQDNNFPRNIKRSVASNGLISEQDFRDWLDPNVASSCDALTADGRDNGIVGLVEDQLDIGNPFSGQYEVGDVQVRCISFSFFFPVSAARTAPY